MWFVVLVVSWVVGLLVVSGLLFAEGQRARHDATGTDDTEPTRSA